MSHRLIVCYEMAEEFVQLYHQQIAEPKPVALAANELIARDIKTPGMSKAAPTGEAKGGFEQLAAAMTAQTIEFFAAPASVAFTGPAPAILSQK